MTVKFIFCLYLAVMSLILFLMMRRDKLSARRHFRRIPEARLFLLAFLGGAAGGTLGMWLFRHKTRRAYFAVGFPLLAALQLFAVSLLK